MMELSERIEEVLEKHDFSVCGEITKRTYNDDGYDVELETYSPEGEDVLVSLTYDGTEEDFICQFRSYAEGFDVEEHAEMWIESRGKNGVPDSIKALLEDAEWIKSTLKEVADDLENIDNEEEETESYSMEVSMGNLKKSREEIIFELLLSLNNGNCGYATEHGEGTPRVDIAIAQYGALVKRGIIKDEDAGPEVLVLREG